MYITIEDMGYELFENGDVHLINGDFLGNLCGRTILQFIEDIQDVDISMNAVLK